MPATAIAITAVATSNIALMAAQEAKRTACKALMNTYDAAKATIDQAQEYAACVSMLYPHEMGPMPWAIKGGIAIILIGTVAGTIHGAIKERDFMDAFMFGLMGAFGGFCVDLVLLGIGAILFA